MRFLIILLTFGSTIQAQTYNWCQHFSFSDISKGIGVSIDSSGNILASIYASTHVTHGINTRWGFVKKYNEFGNLNWTTQPLHEISSSSFNGNKIVASQYYKITTFENTHGNTARSDSFDFYDGHTQIQKISLSNTDLYIAGVIWEDTTNFGQFTLINSSNSPHVFIAKFDSLRNVVWTRQSTDGHAELKTISTDIDGNVYIGGEYLMSMTIGGATITVNPGHSYSGSFIAKFDNNGNLKWLKNIDGNGQEWVSALQCDNRGNVYALGYYDNPLTIDNYYLDKNGFWNDTFFAKFDPNGQCLWAEKLGSSGSDEGTAIWIDDHLNSYITGYVGSPGNLHNLSLSRSGIYIAKFDTNGNGIWASQPTGPGGAAGYAIAGDNKGHIAVTGGFNGTLTFGSQTITGTNEMFVTVLTDQTFVASNNELENSSFNFNIYPNPSGNILNLSYFSKEKIKEIHISVQNNLSQVVYSTNASNINSEYQSTIDLSNQPKGIYFIEIVADDKREVKKIILN